MRKVKATLYIKFTPRQLAEKYGVSIAEINKRIKKGISIEHEHTGNKIVAEKIAIDHIAEKLDYYKNFKH